MDRKLSKKGVFFWNLVYFPFIAILPFLIFWGGRDRANYLTVYLLAEVFLFIAVLYFKSTVIKFSAFIAMLLSSYVGLPEIFSGYFSSSWDRMVSLFVLENIIFFMAVTLIFILGYKCIILKGRILSLEKHQIPVFFDEEIYMWGWIYVIDAIVLVLFSLSFIHFFYCTNLNMVCYVFGMFENITYTISHLSFIIIRYFFLIPVLNLVLYLILRNTFNLRFWKTEDSLG